MFSWKYVYAITLLVVLTICYTHIIHKIQQEKIRTDSFIIYTSAWLANQGKNPYLRTDDTPLINPSKQTTTIPNLSPPFATMCVSVISRWLSEPEFSLGIRLLNTLTSLIAIFLLTNFFFQKQFLLNFLNLTLLSFAFMGTVYSFSFGEISLLLNFILICSMILYHKNKQMSAGALLGFAVNIKLFFGLFILLYLAQKKHKALLSFVITSLVLAAIPIIIYGLAPYLGYIKALSEVDWYSANLNASYFGMLNRIFGDTQARFQSIWHMPILTKIFYYLICLAYIPFIIKTCRKLNSQPALAYGFITTCMLLLSPLGWYYYFPLLISGLIIYFKQIQENKNYLAYLLLLVVILLVLNIPYGMQKSDQTSLLFQLTMGSYLFFCLLIFHFAQWKLINKNNLYSNNPNTSKQALLSNNLLTLVFSAVFLISTSVGLLKFFYPSNTRPNMNSNKNQNNHLTLNSAKK